MAKTTTIPRKRTVRKTKRVTLTNPSDNELREEKIRLRAYELWKRTGNPDAFVNWITAERQLAAEYRRR